MIVLLRGVKALMWFSVFIFIIGMLLNFTFPIQSIPLVRKKEFPFVLQYEIDGKKVTVRDNLVCEFAGYDLYANDMRCIRKWTSYLKSGREQITLFKNNEIEIFYSHKSPNIFGAVYLGDTEIYSEVVDVYPNAWYRINYDRNAKTYIISSEEMIEKYNIKLLNYVIAPPIENTFISIHFLLIGQLCFVLILYCFTRQVTGR